ncbi:MAG: NAD(P)H-quinone oxidoreductase subunit F [Pseudanabaenaceae cyanobacterium bins.68]|nr:NAD(P)H-quinone oxidoreductase subunit F [Pseudanabaenaceae cyanobacterium bins.68]
MTELQDFWLGSAWLVPLYGLVGAIITVPWAFNWIYRTGARPAAYINIGMTLLGLVHSGLVMFYSWGQSPRQISVSWLQVYDLSLRINLDISAVSAGAAVVICAISLLAQVYGLASMETDWAIARFYGLMGFFESAISGVAISDSLFLSYVLLELLTVSTYLLVGFWYAQPQVVTAARDAFWTKRVGDLFLLMGVVALSNLTDSLDFSDLAVWAAKPETQAYFQSHAWAATGLGLALISGPVGKCAQVPLHLWLDEAMEGPNPASVMRNSVVVSCGAFVLIKMSPVLALSPVALIALVVIGIVTAIGAALVAIAQVDLKRALSHTTSAHLGLVFIAVGMQQEEVALAFLFTHAIARALLFMSTGAIMMTTMTQDLEEMGGLWAKMPATTVGFLTASFGLVGLLPLGNFWTLVFWLERLWSNLPLVIVLLAVNSFIAFGYTRVFALVFLGKAKPKTRRAPEVGWQVAVPVLSFTIVVWLLPLILDNLAILPAPSNPLASICLVISGLLGCGVAARIYVIQYLPGSTVPILPKLIALPWMQLKLVFAQDLYVNELYLKTVVAGVNWISRKIAWLDQHLVDRVINLVGIASIFSGDRLRYTITGQSQQYVLTIVVGILMVSILAFISL